MPLQVSQQEVANLSATIDLLRRLNDRSSIPSDNTFGAYTMGRVDESLDRAASALTDVLIDLKAWAKSDHAARELDRRRQ